MKKHLLVLNPGSSSIKLAVFEVNKSLGKQILTASISLQGNTSVLKYKNKKINYQTGFNIKNWWNYLYELIKDYDIKYVGVRMVHGGEEFFETTKVSTVFFKKIKKYNKLAPLHNPVSLELVSLVKDTWPRTKISVSFDTAWYHNLKPVAYLYSLPNKYYQQYDIRKYGFHGLSHEAASHHAAEVLYKKLNKLSIVTCHLGSGASLTWMLDGKVKDTTMGFSPNEGLTMATRSGDIPPSVVFYMASQLKMSLPKIQEVLNTQSGLLGLSGMSDLRNILLACGYKISGYKSNRKFTKTQKQAAKIALEVYIYDIRRYLASYIAMTKKLDAIVFAGPAGQNSIIRSLVLKGIKKPSNTKIIVAPEGELINIANKTIKCLSQ